jgi:hypothetical protein
MAGGLARGVFFAVVALVGLVGSACTDKSGPEYVADQFVDAYFRRIDQEAAKEFTAFGATAALDRELELTKSIRGSGYTPEQATARITYHRGARSVRGERVRLAYEITIHREGEDAQRAADIELSRVQNVWKVVRFDVQQK